MTLHDAVRAAAARSESVSDIINIAATAEALAVTLLGAAISGADRYDGGKGLGAPLVAVLKAAQATERAHYDFLTGAGAQPKTLDFVIPPGRSSITTDSQELLRTIEQLETAFIAAYVAAAREFGALGQPALVKVALQIGGTEAEHRALARLAQGNPLPHNLGFEAASFASVGDAAAALTALGFLGGSGTPLRFSDFVGKVDSSGVSHLTPGGVAASPIVAGASNGTTSPTMPTSLPKTGGIPLGPILGTGAALVLLGAGVRHRAVRRPGDRGTTAGHPEEG